MLKPKPDKPKYPSTKTEQIMTEILEKENSRKLFLPPVFDIMTVRTFSKNFVPYKDAKVIISKFNSQAV